MIVGSSAWKFRVWQLTGDVSMKAQDIDIWNTYSNERNPLKGVKGYDYCQMPKHVIDAFCTQSKKEQIATLEDLLAIKLSHLTYDIFWHKHLQGTLLLSHTLGGSYNQQLYLTLREHWKEEFGNKPYLSLYKTKDEFFDDFVPKQHEHDFLHSLVAFPEMPMYTTCLRANEEVMVDQQKFNLLNHSDKIRMFKEEIAVIALERWVLPSLTKGNNHPKILINEAWSKSLHKTVTALTKNWASEFIVLHIEEFLQPLSQSMMYVIEFFNLKEKYMADQISIDEFREILEEEFQKTYDDSGWGFEFHDALMEGYEDNGIELLEQDGGGEGGSENCYSVLLVNGVYYRVNYRYYSHIGFETDDATVTIVTPREKTIIVYE